MDDILDVLVVAIQGTGVVGDNPAPQHPFGLRDGVTCHHKVIKSDYYYSLKLRIGNSASVFCKSKYILLG